MPYSKLSALIREIFAAGIGSLGPALSVKSSLCWSKNMMSATDSVGGLFTNVGQEIVECERLTEAQPGRLPQSTGSLASVFETCDMMHEGAGCSAVKSFRSRREVTLYGSSVISSSLMGISLCSF